ncbi:hypothetical protein [Modestobacter caceresii]|uniref:hypothetical protein n=1 Tax=Modestobacter caceresii TaxID=1522368 RepID=UPI0012E06B70|nr:hypothetical protein [Modestobacter caceresii]
MTTPDAPDPDARQRDADPPQEDGRGVEIGLSDDAGGTFEPEEDPDDGPST